MPFQTLIAKADLDRRVQEMGAEISRDFEGETVLALCVLKGGVFFTCDLLRAMSIDVTLDFIQVSSYGSRMQTSGFVTLLKEPQAEIRDRAVLIIEDIVDSGLSMKEVTRYISGRGATKVKVATFLDKPAQRRVEFKPDYVGFTIDPHFVIGYGLDFDEKYRNIPEIQIYSE
jgi:hypoxanthine phosphoribosyltransferase